AAASIAKLLALSAADRRTIDAAAADVARCRPSLAADQNAFTDVASSRKALLAALAVLPGRGELPAPMLSDLTEAWQASVSADQPYAQWTADELAQGCVAGDAGDRGYQAAVAADGTATAHKAAFTAAWNPLAARYGLTQYQPGQL
ncbi:MAG: hypothetical protein M3Z75_32440, partial [Actinomycetota bacterium]|nr:hypothetical protein [Actinomycetota bacterium]